MRVGTLFTAWCIALVALFGPARSAHAAPAKGSFELELATGTIACRDGRCRPALGAARRIRGAAVVSRLASRHRGGVLVELSFSVDGAKSDLVLDVPPRLVRDGKPPLVRYEQYRGGRLTFSAGLVRGLVELPERSCWCDDVAFDLLLQDAGRDGRLGTDDDRVQRLSLGRASPDSGFCRDGLAPAERSGFDARTACEFGDDIPAPAARPRRQAPPSAQPPTVDDVDLSGGCGATVAEPPPSGSTTTATGCGGDDDTGWDSDSDPYAGGCESDDSGWDGEGYDDSAGCEGDTSDSSDVACEPDANASARRRSRSRRRPRWWTRIFDLPGVMMLLLALALGRRGRRRRRRRRSQR